MITLKDIAREAGVSVMTVSNVINEKNSKVSKKTIERVQKIISDLHYTPNLSARALAKNESRLIAVFVSTFISHENVFKDPYLSELFGVIEGIVRANGYFVIIQTVENLQSAYNLLQNWHTDGAIFISPQPYENMSFLTTHCSCPIVFIDSYNHKNEDFLTVEINDYKGAYLATKYLIDNGFKKIGFGGYVDENPSVIKERFKGFKKAMEEAGLADGITSVQTLTDYDDGLNIAKQIADGVYDINAIFATADLFALGLIAGLKQHNINVPQDFSIVGFDNLSICRLVSPALTTISQNIPNKAKIATELLFKSIRGELIENHHPVCDVELIERETVKKLS